MLPETVNLPISKLDQLCPLYLLLIDTGASPQLIGTGTVLQKLIATSLTGDNLCEHFELARPREASLDLPTLSQTKKMVVLQCLEPDFRLRGMFIRLSETQYFFHCSIEVTSSDSLQHLEIKINDFTPADPTPDMLILHRFRELQMQDQQKQIEDLRELVLARDTSVRHANTDMLTGIGNRRMFFTQGAELLAEDSNDQVTVIVLMDLDGFKKINDSFGHDVGDAVLQNVAKRCKKIVSGNGIVSRLGGDEFVVLMRLANREAIEATVAELMHSLSGPMDCVGRRLSTQPSMGVSLLEPGQSVEEAIHYADLAMYEGRKKCKGQVIWFTPAMQLQENHRKSLASDIKDAIGKGEFVPWFQPVVDFHSGQIHGYEALARWQHPVHGMVFPDVFIGLAAETGCLHELDYAILASALDQLAAWDSLDHPLSIHINLCATSVRPQLDERVMTLLAEKTIDPGRLTLELTETTLIDFESEEKAVLFRLAELGVNIQLDDFGTGFSSLTHLHDYPVSGLKIDRSFLFDFPNDDRCTELIESVMAISQRLQLAVVTEGIETQEQMDWIVSTGCRYGQGYLFGKPVPASECRHDVDFCHHSVRKVA